jgi:hypothetical protein
LMVGTWPMPRSVCWTCDGPMWRKTTTQTLVRVKKC